MDKILIRLDVPSVGKSYDLFVPANLVIARLCTVLADSVSELCNGRYGISGKEMLVLVSPNTVLVRNRTLADYGIGDGSRLMLI